MAVPTNSVAANFECVRERIVRAAARAGRNPDEITVVAVSKTFPAEKIRAAHDAGVRHFGENRVQEWEMKQPMLRDLDAAWHLVGHLQSNKAARAVRLFDSIDSLDSIVLAEKLARAVAELGSGASSFRLPVLIQVRLGVESTKTGVSEAKLPALAETVVVLPHMSLRGLMCLPPYSDDPEAVRPYFRKLRELRDALAARIADRSRSERGKESLLPVLSMGMSHDFEVAIEEGATQVRLGTALFGARQGA